MVSHLSSTQKAAIITKLLQGEATEATLCKHYNIEESDIATLRQKIIAQAEYIFEDNLNESSDAFQLQEAQLRWRNHELETLNQIAQIAISNLSVAEILHRVIKLSVQTMQVSSGYIGEVDLDANITTILAEYYSEFANPKEREPLEEQSMVLSEQFPDFRKWIANPEGRYIQQIDDPNIPQSERDELMQYDVKTALVVPLFFDNKAIGYLELWESRSRRNFNEQELRLVELIASQLGSVVHNLQLQQKISNHNRNLEVVNRVSKAVSSSLVIEEMISDATRLICEAANGTSAYVGDIDSEAGTTTIIGEYMSEDANELERVSDLGKTYLLAADFPGFEDWLQSVEDSYVSHVDDSDLDESERQHMVEYGAKSLVTIPMRVAKEPIGYIEIWESRHKREFLAEECDLLQSIANQIAIAIQNARLLQRFTTSCQKLRNPKSIIGNCTSAGAGK